MEFLLLEQFQKIEICDSPNSSTALSRLGISYGFCGKDEKKENACFYVKQVHSTDIFFLTDKKKERPPSRAVVADGLATMSRNSIAVKTADCLPLLASTNDSRLVFAVHGGWRGLAQGIINVFTNLVVHYGYKPSSVRVLLGPCISGNVYEVGQNVIDEFSFFHHRIFDRFKHLYVIPQGKNKYKFDIASFALINLLQNGFCSEHMTRVNSCTYQNPHLWYSYRRDKVRQGSNWSWIKTCDY